MSKRKKFSIASDITQGIADSMNAVKNNIGNFRYSVIALSRIEIDPNNPRDLTISPDDVRQGLQKTDPQYLLKKKELDMLSSLSYTIKEKGVLNPIVVYRHQEKYRIIAGERRYLASLIAKKDDIQARIIDGIPDELDIKILQWVENNEREDLILYERIQNIKTMLEAYQKKHQTVKISFQLIQELTGLSKSQASNYFILINTTSDLLEAIKSNKVPSAHKAVLIANEKDSLIREKLIAACATGSNLKHLKELLNHERGINKQLERQKNQNNRRGRPSNHVNLGKVKDPAVVRKLFNIVLEHSEYKHHAPSFSKIDWTSYDAVSKSFAQLMTILSES